MDKVVIVGAGQAGHACARALRAEGFAGEVLLLGAEAVPPYERPPLSKEALLEDAPPDLPGRLPPLEGVAWRGGVEVAALDRAAKRIRTRAGEEIGYDALVLATGGRAARPPIPGAEDPRLFVLRDIADARALRAGLRGGWKHLAVLGGGFIGLEVAAAARLLGVPELRDVTDPAAVEGLPSPLRERARHVVTENGRVLEAVVPGVTPQHFGRLMNASHASLRDDYAVSHPVVDALVAALQAHPDVYGSRMTGAGFGGSLVALVRAGTAAAVGDGVLAAGDGRGRARRVVPPPRAG